VQYVLTFAYTHSKYEKICSRSSFDTDEEIKNGAIDIIYASPETLVGDQDWRSSIKNLNVKVIVVDEFHTIATCYVLYMYNVRVYIAKQLNYIIRVSGHLGN
jgi:replicative superfamily II helicase